MALIPVYTPKYEKVMMEPVDARECIEHCGYSLEPPKPAANKNTPATDDTDDKQGPGTGKPASGDPEAGQKVDENPSKEKNDKRPPRSR